MNGTLRVGPGVGTPAETVKACQAPAPVLLALEMQPHVALADM